MESVKPVIKAMLVAAVNTAVLFLVHELPIISQLEQGPAEKRNENTLIMAGIYFLALTASTLATWYAHKKLT